MIVVMPIRHLITMHPVVTSIARHALVMFMHALVGCCTMRIGFVMIGILRECATGKRQGKENKRDKFRFHSGLSQYVELQEDVHLSIDTFPALTNRYGRSLTRFMEFIFFNIANYFEIPSIASEIHATTHQSQCAGTASVGDFDGSNYLGLTKKAALAR
ncbi:hypothetical protein R75461_07480 [Paraburkholderia nemoris]|nr:hypothetical protein R75461_07480 [Paraburkholderia nemoris]